MLNHSTLKFSNNSNALFGDWDKVGRWLNAASTTIDKFGDAPMEECAELYYKTLIEGIQSQSFDFAPLSQAYLQRKISAGLSPLTLVATGSYIDGIKIIKGEKTGNTYSTFVGADPEAIHEPSGLAMSYIGAIHEYGTRDGKIPARPHYRPAWERCRDECRNIWLRHYSQFGSKV